MDIKTFRSEYSFSYAMLIQQTERFIYKILGDIFIRRNLYGEKYTSKLYFYIHTKTNRMAWAMVDWRGNLLSMDTLKTYFNSGIYYKTWKTR